jgi:2-polyprenyl-3-methyl-5-hydroxy-6-metoxy-1,4-benzoquinol methylase
MKVIISCCPCCKSNNINFALKAIDHTVSKEEFEIWQCNNCTLRFTQSIPGKEEIAVYYKSENYISHSNTNKGLINFMYHKVRSRTLHKKKAMVEKLSGISKGEVLDVGCGTGSFLNTMQQASWKITGVEPDEFARAKAKELYKIDVQSSEIFFTLSPSTFDVITMWHVLEHVHELDEYIAQLRALLKPGGRLFIAVPNYTSYDQGVYKSYWAAYDVPRHLYHFSPKAMVKFLSFNQLKLLAMQPMLFDSFYVSMLSEKYKAGKNNYLKALKVGVISNYKALRDTARCSSIIYIIGK